MKRWFDSYSFAGLLNLLLPGAGHIFWRDYLFGVFVFLIALLAVALVYFSILFPLPTGVKLVLFVLPAVFYGASFFDLYKTVQKKGRISKRKPHVPWLYLGFVIGVQLFAPISPGYFALLNRPTLDGVQDNSLAPVLRRGDRVLRSEAAYRVKVPFWDHPIWLSRPDYGDLVSFVDHDGRPRVGLVLARSGERAEVFDGDLWVNGDLLPGAFPPRLRLSGDMPLTVAQPGSILVATLKLGALDSTFQVTGDRLLGKVYRLF